MSGRKRDYVEEYLYGPFRNNAPRDRLALYETMYMRILTEFATNRFKWTGLPDEIDRRFVEYELFRHALVVFFYDHDYERYFALRGSGTGKWNMYDNPTWFQAIGNTMINRRLRAGSGCIPIWANTVRCPDWDLVLLQATKLAEIERTIEINLTAMRKPFVFAVEDTERLTFTNVWRQVQEGEPVIFGTQLLGESLDNKVKLFDLKIDKDLVINLQLAKAKIWNETMTFLGINNSNQDKRERLVVDEVGANDQQVSAARNSAMGARKYAVEQINQKYSLDISVEWNEDELITPGSDGPMGNSGPSQGSSVADIMSGRSKN
jgi:Phage Connector (GP10)